jgi:hypothetical protein
MSVSFSDGSASSVIPKGFVDRRQSATTDGSRPGTPERRQFSDSRDQTRPEVREFAEAVDKYKVDHHRRFITFEELYDVMMGLGYHK